MDALLLSNGVFGSYEREGLSTSTQIFYLTPYFLSLLDKLFVFMDNKTDA